MRRYLPITIIGVVFLLAIGSGLMLLRWKQPPAAATAPVPEAASPAPAASVEPDASVAPVTASTAPPAPEAAARPEPEALHVRGKANAPVTLEEYGDFQCLPCGAFFVVLAKAEEEFGDRLRVVFRHKPLHQHEHAVLAACAAEAAGLQGRFWEMHDLLFQNSTRWTKGVETVGPDAPPSKRLDSKLLAMPTEVRDVFLVYAEMLKLDLERFKADMDSPEVKARVESDRTRGDSLGIDRTPTIYLNGRLMTYITIRTTEGLHAVIEAELNGRPVPAATPNTPTAASVPPK
jgi:protein-disulfide isomerase